MKAGFCAIDHDVMRTLAREPGLGAEARVLVALMSFIFAFQRPDRSAAVSWRQLAERSDVSVRRCRDVVRDLATNKIIEVSGDSLTATRTYRMAMRGVPQSDTVRPVPHSPAENTQSGDAETAKQAAPVPHSTLRDVPQTLEEEKKFLRSTEETGAEGEETGQPNGIPSPRDFQESQLNAILAVKADCDAHGTALAPLQQARLADLQRKLSTFTKVVA